MAEKVKRKRRLIGAPVDAAFDASLIAPIQASTEKRGKSLAVAAKARSTASSKKKLSEALQTVLDMDPKEAFAALKDKKAPTMADLIALAASVEAASGGASGIKAMAEIGDRTEGKPDIKRSTAQSFVDDLLLAFAAGASTAAMKLGIRETPVIVGESVKDDKTLEAEVVALPPVVSRDVKKPVVEKSVDDDDIPIDSWGKRN